ncbi:S1C family serine protease [Deinococcus aestuarii]|uniref:S1C family serine protease n=1 Tax=Deinococcus aestuarii TaxID=2774531 RepID=UPI001C0C5BB5|nr:S1C family serine protease [Deinococcus aestuarii]
MNVVRPAAARGLMVLSALLLGGVVSSTSPARAQTAAPSSGTTPAERRAATPAPLSQAERVTLDDLYRKLRPATLRIEDCPPTNCREPNGVGTAFLIGDGYALTAYHVVFASKTLSAQTLDKKRYAVQVVGYDDQSDLALIRVNVPAGTPSMPLAATGPRVGDTALAIGNGGGDFLVQKTGRLTGLDSDAGRADFPPGTLELNAQLVPGDSGGPIINAQGEVMGVVSYISVGPGARAGRITAYAVPVTRTSAKLAALRRGEKLDAPVIGIALNPQLDFAFALPADRFSEFNRVFDLGLGDTPGAFFTNVVPGSPAARAGLQPLTLNEQGKRVSGDLVTAVNGQAIANFSDFQYAVRRYRPGETVTLTVLRGGKRIEVRLTLAARPQIQN